MMKRSEAKLNVTRSSLEEMLEAIRKRDDKPKDLPPALPVRPISKARLPSARRSLPNDFKIGERTGSGIPEYLPNGKKRDRKEEDKGLDIGNKMLKVKVVLPAESPYGMEGKEFIYGKKSYYLDVEDLGTNISFALKKEFRVWCQLSNNQWKRGSIQSTNDDDAVVMLSDGSVATVPIGNILPSNPDILDGVDNLIQLSYLNEPSVLHNLESRYHNDKIYTKAGPVLVAINPFKEVQLNKNEVIMAYRQKHMDGPHVCAIAETAFNKMMEGEANSSILISGESGAGKTETAKIVMHYLAGFGGVSEIQNKILETNCILEAFGNAKTSNNHNSSRFGKLIEIHFSSTGKICGAKIETFHLEKSRVVQLTKGERSYHIFYQLCAGASPWLKERLNLKMAGDYDYLKQSECLTIDDVDDAQRFQILTEALSIVQVCKEDQENAFAMLSAVLWLGNISFQVINDESHVEVMEDEAITSAARLMGCDVEDLMLVLSTRRIKAGRDTTVQKLTFTQAIETRDALAKSIYTSLFDWLVEKINTTLEVGKTKNDKSISILDINGFESLQRSSFEQFCRNYANERLQQHFNRHLFKIEQEEYRRDGIDWTKVDFEDNQECLNLFEQKPFGLLSLLDEESTSPNATDLTFASHLRQHLNPNPCFKGEEDGAFRICHFAGEVLYDPSGFLEKSKDHLCSDSIKLLSSCTYQLPQLFASNMLKSLQMPVSPVSPLCSSDSQKQSVGSELKGELFRLMQRLENTTPHFIRCIKSNSKQLPGMFEKDFVLQQLRYCGLSELVRISRTGYPTRMTHQQFSTRYGFLLSKDVLPHEPLSVSIAILQRFAVHPDMYQVGYTKLFLRTGQVDLLEDARRRMLQCIIMIQKCFRGHHIRCHFPHTKNRTNAPESYSLTHKSMQQNEMRAFNDLSAVIFLQSVIRGCLVRRKYDKLQNLKKSNLGNAGANSQPYGTVPNLKDPEHRHDQAPTPGELQRQVLNADAIIKKKEEENTVLKQQLKQFETRWSEYEEKMISMEEIWQKKIVALQTSLAAAKSGVVADEAMGQTGRPENFHYYDSEESLSGGTQTPEVSTPMKLPSRSSDPTPGRGSNGLDAVNHLMKEFDQQKQVFADDARFLVEVGSGLAVSNVNPYDQLQKLRQNFEGWKKDFRVKLRETKSSLNSLGVAKPGRQRKSWWEFVSSRRH